MLAWHIHAVLVILVADNTRIWVGPLTDQSCLNRAHVRLTGTDLEHRLVHNLEEQAHLTFVGKPSPCPVGRSHILDVEFIADWGDCGMDVGQVLVFGEVQKVGLFATDRDFLVVRYLNAVPERGALDDLKCQHIVL
jgi:hypothetical protein